MSSGLALRYITDQPAIPMSHQTWLQESAISFNPIGHLQSLLTFNNYAFLPGLDPGYHCVFHISQMLTSESIHRSIGILSSSRNACCIPIHPYSWGVFTQLFTHGQQVMLKPSPIAACRHDWSVPSAHAISTLL